MLNLKSKITKSNDIDWSETIYLEDLKIDPQILESHRQRIDTIFANLTDQERQQQLHNIVVRDNLFSHAMNKLIKYYEFEIDESDIIALSENVIKTFGEQKKPFANEIAKKLIIKSLIFDDLQKKYNINISDQELIKILEDYYQKTNQPIRDFMQDKQKFQSAKDTLVDEKITAFIVDKFPKNLEKLEQKIQEVINQSNQNLNNKENK